MSCYDIIGDIHGEADSLVRLLDELGYEQKDGIFRHTQRQVIFLGDFIDRGQDQRGVLEIVRPMIENGAAVAVMGNHEFNAIAYATENDDGFLRAHSDKNAKQHCAFLNAFEGDPDGYADAIEWFKTLPLWLDLPELRVVHACWDAKSIKMIGQAYDGSRLSHPLLIASSTKSTWEFEAVETILKGKELLLPSGFSFPDKDGINRHSIRVKWWNQQAETYRSAYIGPPSAETHIPDDVISGDHLIEYSENEKPVFLGHYWLTGTPAPLASNIACVDYSVANVNGTLAAYRFDGEATLNASRFITVPRSNKSLSE